MDENRTINNTTAIETKPETNELAASELEAKRLATKTLALLAVCSTTILLIVVISAAQSSKDRARLAGDTIHRDLPALHETPRELPTITFTDGEGRETSLAAFKGQVVVVNFWATWCGPCVRELPSLMRLTEIMKDRNLALITLSQDLKGAEVVVPFMKKNGLSGLPVFYDPKGTAARALSIPHLPTTLLIDAKGREAGRFEGAYEWNQPQILEVLGVLEKPPAPAVAAN